MSNFVSKIVSENLRVLGVLVKVARLNPVRIIGSVIALVVVALLEGISVVTLLPLLTIILGKSGPDQHGINAYFEQAIAWIGFKPSLEVFLVLLVLIVLLKTALNMLATLQIARAQADTIRDLRTRLLRGPFERTLAIFRIAALGSSGQQARHRGAARRRALFRALRRSVVDVSGAGLRRRCGSGVVAGHRQCAGGRPVHVRSAARPDATCSASEP